MSVGQYQTIPQCSGQVKGQKMRLILDLVAMWLVLPILTG